MSGWALPHKSVKPLFCPKKHSDRLVGRVLSAQTVTFLLLLFLLGSVFVKVGERSFKRAIDGLSMEFSRAVCEVDIDRVDNRIEALLSTVKFLNHFFGEDWKPDFNLRIGGVFDYFTGGNEIKPHVPIVVIDQITFAFRLFAEAQVWHGSEVFGWRSPAIMPSNVESRPLANDYRSLEGWDEARTHDLQIRHTDVGSLCDIGRLSGLLRRFQLPLHYVPLPVIDVGLENNGDEHQKTERVYGYKANAFGMLGDVELANNGQDRDSNDRKEDSPHYWLVVGILVGLFSVCGFFIWHICNRYWGDRWSDTTNQERDA